jgi:hypothetical protein
MSNLVPKIIPLTSGLDLSSPKLLAEPGSLIDCLNYETVDFLGYRRIDGYTRYDGNVYISDIPSTVVYTATCSTAGVVVTDPATNDFVEDDDGNDIGYVFSVTVTGVNTATIVFMPFTAQTESFGGTVSAWSFTAVGTPTITTITQTQLIAFEQDLRDLVDPLPYTPCGLHWSERKLYAVVPLVMVPYAASDDNQVVNYVIGDSLTTSGTADAQLLDKVIIEAAGVSTAESGYFIIGAGNAGTWAGTLGGAVSVGAGTITSTGVLLEGENSTACGMWRAQRPATYNFSKAFSEPGWNQLASAYTARVTLTQPQSPFNARARNDSTTESTYYFDDGVVASPIEFVLLDYFVVSGSFDDGDAVVDIQFTYPGEDILTTFTMYLDSAATVDLADVTARMTFNALPGFPQLKQYSSRYQFRTANFYATDDTTTLYGVNGAGRGFTLGFSGVVTFIHTQDDEDQDRPRHIENHLLHLALGFGSGSVQLSVVGQPTNFDGLEGASEHGVGDTLTGLMSLNGTTLGVFCSNSIWSITGSIVDNFQLQVISPKTGCIEYTLASCGEPYYLDSRGVCTLGTSANYGDFVGSRISDKVSSWLRPRLRQGIIGLNNAAGVACAFPVREKNQYRVYFNDGLVLTTTLRGSQQSEAFTWQKLFLNQSTVSTEGAGIIPFAWTSEVDSDGKERLFVAHYNENSTEQSTEVYALDAGTSFDGNYIPHYFTTNWTFMDNPVQYQTLQAIRLHGLSKGMCSLKVQAAGAQNDFYFSGTSLTTTTTPINLPRTAAGILSDFKDVTNRVEIAARGLATQLRFSGSNTTIGLIEPSHVAQVLITFTSPDGAYDT